MVYAERVEQRIDFALNSPDFWRGLGIALAILATFTVVRVLVRVLRTHESRPLVSTWWSQAAGLASWLMMAAAAVGFQISQLGQDSWSYRLPLTLLGGVFAICWAYGTFKNRKRTPKNSDQQKIDSRLTNR